MPGISPSLEEVEPDTELVLRRMDGRGLPVVVNPVAVTHERRGTVGYALIVRDRRDVVALRHRLVNSARLAAVGDLSAGIAREIMRPILDVRGSLSDLELHFRVLTLDVEKAGLGERAVDIVEEGRDLIAESLEGVDRVTDLVRSVQGFAPPTVGKPERTDPNTLVEHALRVALSGFGKTIDFRLDLQPDLPPIACRRSELEQVIINLVVNACHAVGDDGRVVVTTGTRAGGVRIRVIDDGCGVPLALRDRIFDPFFTTKPVGEGTGLGLAICYHIVRNHGGSIAVDSVRGRGATFTVDLPTAVFAEDAPAEPDARVAC
jgi:signal transduction histidine kinase